MTMKLNKVEDLAYTFTAMVLDQLFMKATDITTAWEHENIPLEDSFQDLLEAAIVANVHHAGGRDFNNLEQICNSPIWREKLLSALLAM